LWACSATIKPPLSSVVAFEEMEAVNLFYIYILIVCNGN
jgi:hypothetical protein